MKINLGLGLLKGFSYISIDNIEREEKHRMTTPFSGWLPCRRITVEMLYLGNTPIRSAQVNVTTNNNPFGQDDFTLGMGFFKETVIVLDFKNELLWIRNPAKPTAIHGPKTAKEI